VRLADLAVSHLSRRQPTAAPEASSVVCGKVRQSRSKFGVSASSHGVARPGRRAAPAVEDDEEGLRLWVARGPLGKSP